MEFNLEELKKLFYESKNWAWGIWEKHGFSRWEGVRTFQTKGTLGVKAWKQEEHSLHLHGDMVRAPEVPRTAISTEPYNLSPSSIITKHSLYTVAISN